MAVNQGTDNPGYTPDVFIQQADNIDHNTRTLDRSRTFHGMGIIAIMTPSIQCRKILPKKQVKIDEMATAGDIDTCVYKEQSADNVQLLYKEQKDLKVTDATANLGLLCNISLPLLHLPGPGWPGTMQRVCDGNTKANRQFCFFL